MQDKIFIDIIILSYAKTDELKQTTIAGIDSLLNSEDTEMITFNIIVIESNQSLKPYQFPNSLTIYPDVDFGYNRYMNLGLKQSANQYVCLCNNDLIFHKKWASNIIKQMELDKDLKSVSPYCDISHVNNIEDNGQNVVSTQNGVLIGWCIFFKREILAITGYLDERFKFWYADNDYGSTMAKYHIKHALVTSSKVTHLGSKTHVLLNDEQLFNYTYGQFLYYDLKWNNGSTLLYHIKNVLLPVFKPVYLNRSASKLNSVLYRAFAKLYGGVK